MQLAYHIESINTQYMGNSDTIYLLKMEHVSKNNIFGLKWMMKSGLFNVQLLVIKECKILKVIKIEAHNFI